MNKDLDALIYVYKTIIIDVLRKDQHTQVVSHGTLTVEFSHACGAAPHRVETIGGVLLECRDAGDVWQFHQQEPAAA